MIFSQSRDKHAFPSSSIVLVVLLQFRSFTRTCVEMSGVESSRSLTTLARSSATEDGAEGRSRTKNPAALNENIGRGSA